MFWGAFLIAGLAAMLLVVPWFFRPLRGRRPFRRPLVRRPYVYGPPRRRRLRW
ncbi:MAG: hypothetical protein JXB35_07035 [Anaerolineae bacterium]|nr:hypothetical protein [Anaerolineae bacterium]